MSAFPDTFDASSQAVAFQRQMEAEGIHADFVAPEQLSGRDSTMNLIRRLPLDQARPLAIGQLALFASRPDLRRQFSTNDLAVIEALGRDL